MSNAVATKLAVRVTKLTNYDRAAIRRVLNAAGEVLVTRAMARTCKPKYKNKGWDNCFFTAMFGGKANLNRLAEAWMRAEGNEAGISTQAKPEYASSTYIGAIAAKIDAERDDVSHLIDMFDSPTETDGDWNDAVNEYVDNVVIYGKVVAMLTYIDKWLAKRGIVFAADLTSHKTA